MLSYTLIETNRLTDNKQTPQINAFNANSDIAESTLPMIHDTLTMLDAGEAASIAYTPVVRALPRSYFKSHAADQKHSIEDFLSRDVRVSTKTWTTSDALGTVLYEGEYPYELFKQGGTPAIAQNIAKATGFSFFRAKLTVTVRLTTQPTQAGVLLLSYYPGGQSQGQHEQNNSNSLGGLTANPSVLFNLATTNSAELVDIPLVSAYSYVNLVTGQGDYGSIKVSVVSPLASNGTTTADLSVWARFTDVELLYPTNESIATTFAQIGGEFSHMHQTGAISNIVSGIGRAASYILPNVGLSALSRPVENIAHASANMLNLLGFSKPTTTAPVSRLLQVPASNMWNYDGADTSHKAGASIANELVTMTGFAGTDVDEMSYSTIAQRSAYIGSFNWTTNNAAGVVLKTYYLNPLALTQSITTTADPIYAQYYPPPAFFLAGVHAYWRGGFHFTFHFAKTKFHAGRLRVTFRPFAGVQSADAQLDVTPGMAHSQIVDLTESAVMKIHVPYNNALPWLSCNGAKPGRAILGSLEIAVVNALVASAAVSTTVNVTSFVSMDADASFACPTGPQFMVLPDVTFPFKEAAPIAATNDIDELINLPKFINPRNKRTTDLEDYGVELEEIDDTEAQIGGTSANNLSAEVRQHDTESTATTLLPNALTTGEGLNSIRQLLKTFRRVGKVTKTSATKSYVISPWWVSKTTETSGTTLLLSSSYVDYFSYFYQLYSFFRGSMRLKIYFDRTSIAKYDASLPIRVTISTTLLDTRQADPGNNEFINEVSQGGAATYVPGLFDREQLVFLDKSSCIEIDVPYYCAGHMVPCVGTQNQSNRQKFFQPLPLIVLSNTQGASFYTYRACGDDFSFGGLHGASGLKKMDVPNTLI